MAKNRYPAFFIYFCIDRFNSFSTLSRIYFIFRLFETLSCKHIRKPRYSISTFLLILNIITLYIYRWRKIGTQLFKKISLSLSLTHFRPYHTFISFFAFLKHSRVNIFENLDTRFLLFCLF